MWKSARRLSAYNQTSLWTRRGAKKPISITKVPLKNSNRATARSTCRWRRRASLVTGWGMLGGDDSSQSITGEDRTYRTSLPHLTPGGDRGTPPRQPPVRRALLSRSGAVSLTSVTGERGGRMSRSGRETNHAKIRAISVCCDSVDDGLGAAKRDQRTDSSSDRATGADGNVFQQDTGDLRKASAGRYSCRPGEIRTAGLDAAVLADADPAPDAGTEPADVRDRVGAAVGG